MTRPSRRTLAIGGVVAVLLVAAMMARDNEPVDPAATAVRPGAGPASPTGAMPVVDLKLELLKRPRPELEDAERNLFRFQARPAPPAPPVPPRVLPPPAATVGPPVMAAPSGPQPPPPIPVRFIGLVDAPSQAVRVAILSDGRGNVFTGKEGDIIEGRYKVLKLSQDAVELAYIDGRGRQTIRLSGQ